MTQQLFVLMTQLEILISTMFSSHFFPTVLISKLVHSYFSNDLDDIVCLSHLNFIEHL